MRPSCNHIEPRSMRLTASLGLTSMAWPKPKPTIESLNRTAEDREDELQSRQTQFNDFDNEYGIDKHELAEARAYIRELENSVMEYDADLSHSKAFGPPWQDKSMI
jgi:hypothetical protein